MSNPTKADKIYWDRLIDEVGCVACRINGISNRYATIHHIDGRTKPGAHRRVLPLCGPHHQTGGEGVAIHPFKAQWEAKYGNQYDLLAHVNGLLGG